MRSIRPAGILQPNLFYCSVSADLSCLKHKFIKCDWAASCIIHDISIIIIVFSGLDAVFEINVNIKPKSRCTIYVYLYNFFVCPMSMQCSFIRDICVDISGLYECFRPTSSWNLEIKHLRRNKREPSPSSSLQVPVAPWLNLRLSCARPTPNMYKHLHINRWEWHAKLRALQPTVAIYEVAISSTSSFRGDLPSKKGLRTSRPTDCAASDSQFISSP